MSRGLKLYGLALLLGLATLLFKWLYQPADVRQLNQRLQQDPQLSAFPYPFRVLRIERQTAVISSPRSAEVPVPVMVGAIYPEAAGLAVDNPRYQQAQQQLARHQGRAASLVKAHSGIKHIRWQLDRAWLQQHGIRTW